MSTTGESGAGVEPVPGSPTEAVVPGLSPEQEVWRVRIAIQALLQEALDGASGPIGFRMATLINEFATAVEARTLAAITTKLADERDTVVLRLPGNRPAQKAAFLYAEELEDQAKALERANDYRPTESSLRLRDEVAAVNRAGYRHIEERLLAICTAERGQVLEIDGSPWLRDHEGPEVTLSADWSWGPGMPPAPGLWVWRGRLESREYRSFEGTEYDVDWDGDWHPMTPEDLRESDIDSGLLQEALDDLFGVSDPPTPGLDLFPDMPDCPPEYQALLDQVRTLWRRSGRCW